MKRLLLLLLTMFMIYGVAYAEDSIYLMDMDAATVATGTVASPTAGTPIPIKLPSQTSLVFIYGGLVQDEDSTQWDFRVYSDLPLAGAVRQEDCIYEELNITTGYIVEEEAVFLTAIGDTNNTVYGVVTNDGSQSDFDMFMIGKQYNVNNVPQ